MNKDTDKLGLTSHNISITERQNIQINGVTKIDSFDNDEFLLETELGTLGIKGKGLEIIKLDTYEGTIAIKGVIDALSYFDTPKSKKENSVISRLFK